LYGVDGFYRSNYPADHFRTSPHVSSAFAAAVVELARQRGLNGVCDIGAGSGELLAEVHRREPGWNLLGVEVRPRPPGLPAAIGWQHEEPQGFTGLVFANELLDNIACDVVELDAHEHPRVVEVDPSTGAERLGPPAGAELLSWLSRWWPLGGEGARAEVGLARDALWARICAANPGACRVAVDYGHVRSHRPVGGTLSSYRLGAQTTVSYDRHHDVTAHVAVDSLAAAVGGTLLRQRDVLQDLGLDGRRPPIDTASLDPRGYVAELSRATEVAELIEVGGLGDLYWVISGPG